MEQLSRPNKFQRLLGGSLAFLLVATQFPGGILRPILVQAATLDLSSAPLEITGTEDYTVTGIYTGGATAITVRKEYQGVLTLKDVNISIVRSPDILSNSMGQVIDGDGKGVNAVDVEAGFQGTIILNNVSIKTEASNNQWDTRRNDAAFSIGQLNADPANNYITVDQADLINTTKVELRLRGSNFLQSNLGNYPAAPGQNATYGFRAGLEVWKGAQVYIINDDDVSPGSLLAQCGNDREPNQGYDRLAGAGIGAGNLFGSGGDVIIGGGAITALGGVHGAGIGGSWNGPYTATVLIYGGEVTSVGGYHAAGIGGGCYQSYNSENNPPVTKGSLVVLPSTNSISAIATPNLTGEKQAVDLGQMSTMLYFGDTNQPKITLQTAPNDQGQRAVGARIYADFSNIDIINDALALVDDLQLEANEVYLGETNSSGYLEIHASFDAEITFFTQSKTPHRLHYLAVTQTVQSDAGPVTIELPFPVGPEITLDGPVANDAYAAQGKVLSPGYNDTVAKNNAATITFINNSSDADIKVGEGENLHIQFLDPDGNFDAAAVNAELGRLTDVGYLFKDTGDGRNRLRVAVPLLPGREAGIYTCRFRVVYEDEDYNAQGAGGGVEYYDPTEQYYTIIQQVSGNGVHTIQMNPDAHGSGGGRSTATLMGINLDQVVTDGLQLRVTGNDGSFLATVQVLDGDLVAGSGNTRAEVDIDLPPRQPLVLYRNDVFTATVWAADGAREYHDPGVSATVEVGDSDPVALSLSASPQVVGTKGGDSVVTVHGHYLYNFSKLQLYDEINHRFYPVEAQNPGDEQTARCAVKLPPLEGVYRMTLYVDGGEYTSPDDGNPVITDIAVGEAGTYLSPEELPQLEDIPPQDPDDKEWTGRGVGHKGGGFTGGDYGVDFLYHHCKQAWLQNPENATVTLQDIWMVAEIQLVYAAQGANEGSFGARRRVQLQFDTVSPHNSSVLEGRLMLDPFDAGQDIYTVVCTCEEETRAVRSLFASRYGNSNLCAVSLVQEGTYGMQVEVMVYLDMQELDTSDLVLYRYDSASDTFRPMKDASQWVDENGFLHFYTRQGGYVVVADRPVEQSATGNAPNPQRMTVQIGPIAKRRLPRPVQ